MRQVQASRLRTDQRLAGDLGNDFETESDGHQAAKRTLEPTNIPWLSSRAACTTPFSHGVDEANPSALGSGRHRPTGASRGHQADTQEEYWRWEAGNEVLTDESRKRRKLGRLRMHVRVLVKKASVAYYLYV